MEGRERASVGVHEADGGDVAKRICREVEEVAAPQFVVAGTVHIQRSL